VCKAGKETGPPLRRESTLLLRVRSTQGLFHQQARLFPTLNPKFWFTTQLISLLGRKQMYSKAEVCFMVILGSDHFMASEFEAIYLER